MKENKPKTRPDNYDDGARGFMITKEYIESLRQVDEKIKKTVEEERKKNKKK